MTARLKDFIRGAIVWTGIVAAAPIALVVGLLRPLVLIRFGTLRSDRIGHFASDTEAYAQERKRRTGRPVIDVIGCPEPVCNQQLRLMWGRTFPIAPGDRIWRWEILARACRVWTRSSAHEVRLYDRSAEFRFYTETPPALAFTADEHRRGAELLVQLGIPAGAKWVCIHNRDSAYLDAVGGGRYAHHDYRDFSVETIVAAAEELACRGYYVVRVGSIVAEPLVSPNIRIIDYANSSLRSDFLDMYLLAGQAFFLGNDSGIWGVPLIFRRPLAMTNFVWLANFYEKDYEPWLFIPKRLTSRSNDSPLSLRELLKKGLGDATRTHDLERAGVDLQSNTGDEIRDLAIEMDERARGTWSPTAEDQELQNRFWQIFREHAGSRLLGPTRARVGAAFLRKHRDLVA